MQSPEVLMTLVPSCQKDDYHDRFPEEMRDVSAQWLLPALVEAQLKHEQCGTPTPELS